MIRLVASLFIVVCLPSRERGFVRGFLHGAPKSYGSISSFLRASQKRLTKGFPRSLDSPLPTVINPISKRKIRLGGPTYNSFIKFPKWIQHNGTLQEIDLETLGAYLEQRRPRHPPCFARRSDETNNSDEWYCIQPSVVTQNSKLRPLDEMEASLLNQQLLFVHKPAGLPTVPPRDLSDSLASQVAAWYPTAKPCHRLDRDTSGVVVFGLTAKAHRDISQQFEARRTSKTYVALVAGRPRDGSRSGMVDLPIGKEKTSEGFNRWVIGGIKARQAVTEWRVDRIFTDTTNGAQISRVVLAPKTGRGHQLRLHMKAIGCPILGDPIHGEAAVATCSPRLCLHAAKLQVDWNGLRLEAESVPFFWAAFSG